MIYKTEAGKEIEAVLDPKTCRHRIQFTSGGELPIDLQGIFTNKTFADRAIVAYLGRVVSKKAA